MKFLKIHLCLFLVVFVQISCSEKVKEVKDTVENTKQLSYHEKYLKEISELPISEFQKEDTLNMIKIKGGEFLMGGISRQARKDEFPRHKESVQGFWIDKNEVTNREFSRFIEATGYITTAERTTEIEGKIFDPGALVFNPDNPNMWWKFQSGANWKHPYGSESTIEGKENHPVVQVSWYDAMAYTHWSGKRLPTEVEWEYAAKGGTENQIYFWGNDFTTATQYANFFQGDFPVKNNVDDTHEKTAEVRKFPKNGFGLYDIAGNVWEWCLDTYYPNAYQILDKREDGYFKQYYNSEQQKVVRGGSFLCSESYCTGYRISARMSSTPDSGLEHTGFRCVRDVR
ncbi:formylglycine-generating enzyme family protein [Aquimarina sp. RZ0]|uniref:formylglycine-generating enzyme family protein n=1 Tax=Aquimarina sp. RZ0 TaxID=2607730 RepID=UPI0011F3BF06|nr:formylglycine-generating enzyme family protein [Aquimarina sp. RZ0]KAA1243386.1 formylglycine-generating enzyme family protein [Aquimarina sp. RZ0]